MNFTTFSEIQELEDGDAKAEILSVVFNRAGTENIRRRLSNNDIGTKMNVTQISI